MDVKVAIELYYIFSKFRNLNTGNFLMTISILTLLCRLNIYKCDQVVSNNFVDQQSPGLDCWLDT